MREVYVAAYARDRDAWREIAAPTVVPPLEVVLPSGANPPEWTGAGNGFTAYPALAAQLELTQLDADARPTAQAIGELALPRLRAGKGASAATALPFTCVTASRLTTSEREAGLEL
jgi:tRNA A37 threonylcarbamoyladenosine modification protein TsaB